MKNKLEKRRLYQLSAAVTFVFMTSIFVVSQFLTYSGLRDELKQRKNVMQVQELIKLQFTKQQPEEQPKKFAINPTRISIEKKIDRFQKEDQPEEQKTPPSVATIAGGFDLQKLISHRSASAKRGAGNRPDPIKTGVSVAPEHNTRSILDLNSHDLYSDNLAPVTASRRALSGGSNGTRVNVGAGRSAGAGAGATDGVGLAGDGVDGSAFTGTGTGKGRTLRGSGNGNGSASITLPSVIGGDDAAIDLHALIKWMKAHPGTIPKLVAYDMGHRPDDLSSSVLFLKGNRQYRLFLSCNEIEQLLRICLIEAEDYTLLKDNGIRESSNYLTVGDVVKKAGDIQSLISSRQAPAEQADRFYQIFWNWWQQQDAG